MPHFLCTPELPSTPNVIRGVAIYQEYNKVAVEVLADMGGDTAVVDAYSMALSRPEQSFDGQHYTASEGSRSVLDDVVYMNIRTALLHELCAGK
jgi:hypothetical protein